MRSLDFSSWQALLSTLLVMQTVQQRRDRGAALHDADDDVSR